MASDHTRSAILAAAERLYADRGFGDVTLRDIVAEANVNLAAVNYHFGSKDELIAELFVTRSLATNRERLNELKAAEEAGGGRASIEAIMHALVGPTLRGCLGPDREGSTAARFMIRASIESVPPIRRIKNREVDHLRKFVAAMRRSLPGRDDAELYWGLHFALAMSHHTIREKERLTKLSEGQCDLNDVECDRRTRGRGVGDGADRRRAREEGAGPVHGAAVWPADPAGSVSYDHRHAIDLDVERPGPFRDANEDAGRRILRKVARVDRIDGRKVPGRGAVDIALHHIVQRWRPRPPDSASSARERSRSGARSER